MKKKGEPVRWTRNHKRLISSFRATYFLICLFSAGMFHLSYGQASIQAMLRLTVKDETGEPVAFRARVFDHGKLVTQDWERGKTDLTVIPGVYTVLISHGFNYDAVRFDNLDLSASVTEKSVTLRKRYDLVSRGWYCGESHMHGQHGSADRPQTFSDAARLAEANGLNYIQIAQWWTTDFSWTSIDTLETMSRQASTPLVAVNWNLESPKCYMGIDDGGKTGNLHCYGHGCTLGLKERPYDKAFWFTGPNFPIINEIHRQNAVVMLAHPYRFWFNNGNFVSNMANEIAFDYVVGQGYDAVDILNDGEPLFFEHERVWWNLLNMGYKVSGTAGSDGSIADGEAGRYRTYTRINGTFSWDKIAQGIRDGACVASSGPMVLFSVDGKDPGTEFPADGKKHLCNLKVWSGPLPSETLVAAQLIRNGEIVRAWDLRSLKTREWSGEFEISDISYAWYAIRVTATCKDPGLLRTWTQPAEIYDEAVASPVYFIPDGFLRPSPAKATVKLNITDDESNPLAGTVSVIDYGKEISTQNVAADGSALIIAPASANLVITAAGFDDFRIDLFRDSPVYVFCQNFNDYFTPGGFNELRTLLGNISFRVKLKRGTQKQ
jgi:hypothetical protein